MWHNLTIEGTIFAQALPMNPRRLRGRGVYFLEPLDTCAPGPSAGVQPYCCYVNTIVFYKVPRQLTLDGYNYEEWDRIETRWDNLGQRWTDQDWGWQSLAPLVLHDECIYEISIGEVIWRNERWFMQWSAWRLGPEDHRWPWILERSRQEYPPVGQGGR